MILQLQALSALLLATTAIPGSEIPSAPTKAEPTAPAVAWAASARPGVPTPEQLLAMPRLLVIAHRGYSGIAPENTLPAFELAAGTGADLIELDYRHSADNVPVVLHDKTLDRTTDSFDRWGQSKLTIEDKTAADLATLDAGKWFAPRYAGTKLPTLSESIDCINRHAVTLVERKEGDAPHW